MSTASVLEALDDEHLYEIIDGQKVEVLPMGALAGRLTNHLAYYLNAHAIPANLGEANVENLFHLALPVDRNRRPDLAFVSYDRWPKGKHLDFAENAWDVVPNLIVEAISPSDFMEEVLEKIGEYFRAGVQLVWLIFPKLQQLHVYESPTAPRVLTKNNAVDGGIVLPLFRLDLKDLFID